MATKTIRNTIGAGLVTGLAAFLVYAFLPQPVPVDMAEIDRAPLTVTIDDEGKTRVRDVYRLSAPVSGRVLRIEADVGDKVIANDTILAHLLPTEPNFLDARALKEAEAKIRAAEAAVELARAEVAKSAAEVDFAAAELTRAKRLARNDTVSQSALDRAQLQARSSRAALASAKAEVTRREAELETARAVLVGPATPATVEAGNQTGVLSLRMPVSGEVLAVLQESESVVTAGTPLVEVGDPRDLEVVVDLLSDNAVKVSAGDKVLVDEWGGGASLSGVVRRVEPTGFTKVSALGIDEQRVNVIIDPVPGEAGWERLGHNYRVVVRIVIWHGDDVLRVPLSALFRLDREWAVFKVVDGHAEATRVKIGHRNTSHAEVLSGLKEGDQIVLYPGEEVEDGSPVEPRSARN